MEASEEVEEDEEAVEASEEDSKTTSTGETGQSLRETEVEATRDPTIASTVDEDVTEL